MAIRFVLGPAGSGKSTYLRNYIIHEAEKNPSRTYFYFVPDQFTLSAQRELVAASKNGVTINIEALSFERFARRVFNELMIGLPGILDDTGKALLIEKIIKAKGSELSVLSGAEKRPGTIDEIKSFLSELRQYNVSIDELREAGEDMALSPAFKKKTGDLVTIFSAFEEGIRGKYITPEEVLTILTDCIDRSELAKNSTFVFDGYTGFTPLQFLVIQKLMGQSGDLSFALSLGSEEALSGETDEEELFHLTKKTVNKLLSLARETGTEVLEPVRLPLPGQKSRFPEGSRLSFLEQNIFRPRKAAEKQPDRPAEEAADTGGEKTVFAEPVSGTCDVTELEDPRAELMYTAFRIRKLVRERGLHYRDMAVLCADLSEDSFLLPEIFDACQIPYFLDEKADLTTNPLPVFISAAVSCSAYRFSYEDVVRTLRTGFCGFSDEELDLFDSYLFASGIHGVTAFRRLFAILPEGFTTEDLTIVNSVRAGFMEAMGPFYDAVKKKGVTVKACLTALFDLFTAFGVEEKMKGLSEEFSAADNEVLARQYSEIYPQVIGTMDRMAELSGEEETDILSFGKSMAMALSELTAGVLPASSDCVTVGDLTRTRVEGARVLFLIGASDAAIPKKVSGGGILSEAEREKLLSLTLELAPTARENAFIQRYYLYLALTKPSEELHITYGRHSADGAPVRASYLVTELLSLLGKGIFTSFDELPFEAEVAGGGGTKRLAKDLCAYRSGLLSGKEFERMLLLLGTLDEKGEKRKGLLGSAFFRYQMQIISEEVLNPAHEQVLLGSVSNLETYGECPYKYFLTYRLGLTDRENAELQSSDIGSFFHAVLASYIETFLERGQDFATIDDAESDRVLSEAFGAEVARMKKAAALSDAAELYAVENIRKTLYRTVWALRKQAARGSYRPVAVEVPLTHAADFSDGSWDIGNGRHLAFRGSIDRVDTFTAGGKVYVRIIDYKSSDKGIDYTGIYNGLSLQLPTYMGLALSMTEKSEKKAGTGREVLPGAFLYSHIHNPILQGPLASPEGELSRQRLSDFCMTGAYIDDETNLTGLDAALFSPEDTFSGKSPVVPLGINKDGKLSKNNSRISTDDMRSIIAFTKEKEKNFAAAIDRGEFPVSPSSAGESSSCTYCSYKGVCGFERGLPGFELRKLKKRSLSDITDGAEEPHD